MDEAAFQSPGSTIQQSAEVTPSQNFLRQYAEMEDDPSGPVFVQLPDQMGWIKVNNFSACDHCRISHVKCSLSVTGGPCRHCKNRNQLCKVYGWVFNPECPAYYIYKPVLPPPPAAPSSPLYSSKSDEYEFEWELLVHKLDWLQRQAPRKFRKRCSAMPWKDEPKVTSNETQNHQRLYQQIPSSGLPFSEQTNGEGSVSRKLAKRRRASMEAEFSCQYDCEGEEPVLPSTQHRMSISFILSSCDSDQPSKPEKKNQGSAVPSVSCESRRTSVASSEAGWSTASETRSSSVPSVDSLPRAMNSRNISFRNPPVPHRINENEILSKFKEWRPPFHPPVISSKSYTFSTI